MVGLLEDLGGAITKTGLPSAWPVAAKPCDYCKSAAAMLFCRVDSAFLCMDCDCKIHVITPNKLGHERVWMCEVCEQAPASFTCKADAAALCVTCDRDIHSANPLSRRHERIPVVPFYDTAESVVRTTASTLLAPVSDNNSTKQVPCLGQGNLPDSWIFPDQISSKFAPETPDLKSVEFLLSQSDQLLGFDFPISNENQFNPGSDSVVPVQAIDLSLPPKFVENSAKNTFEIDFTRSNINSFNNSFTAPSLMHSVSSSSMDVGVVPDGSSISETSYSFGLSMNSSVDFSGTAASGGRRGGGNYQSSQVSGVDRKARVLRYIEKRKNRKFEKTIRYASRKAYAETRPRIKGRFAKRTEVEVDVDVNGEIDQLFASASSGFSITDSRYGVVPTFQ